MNNIGGEGIGLWDEANDQQQGEHHTTLAIETVAVTA
jgi:hypothetical protein